MGSVKNLVITTKIEHWNDLILLNQRFLGKFVFRGQGNSECENMMNDLHHNFRFRSIWTQLENAIALRLT